MVKETYKIEQQNPRPAHGTCYYKSKETDKVKRDLYHSKKTYKKDIQKRPKKILQDLDNPRPTHITCYVNTCMSKETYMIQKRPTNKKPQDLHNPRPTHGTCYVNTCMSKETDTSQKRPTKKDKEKRPKKKLQGLHNPRPTQVPVM